jgi:hypothetical protein
MPISIAFLKIKVRRIIKIKDMIDCIALYKSGVLSSSIAYYTAI